MVHRLLVQRLFSLAHGTIYHTCGGISKKTGILPAKPHGETRRNGEHGAFVSKYFVLRPAFLENNKN